MEQNPKPECLIIKTNGGNQEVHLIEKYKEHLITDNLESIKDPSKSCIQVYNPISKTLFIVALDDSKLSGKRVFADSTNTVKEARLYIDWVTDVKIKQQLQAVKDKSTSKHSKLTKKNKSKRSR